MISYLLYGIFILACLTLVVSVLLQPGKADAGQLFTSSVSSTAFGPRGTQTRLAKITVVAAAAFLLVALLLGLGIGSGQRSLMEGGAPKSATTPAPAASPAQQQPAQPEGAAPAQNGAPAQAPTAGTATPAATPESNSGADKKQ